MLLICLNILAAMALGYCLLPNLYARHLSRRVVRRLNTSKNQIGLTFDDGPNSWYTPRLLDLLESMEVKATFFLVAEQALHNPELTKRILKQGHEIGMHSLSHRSAWLSSPLQTWLDFTRSVMVFKELGLPLVFYRPPWGTFNLCTQFFSQKQHLKTVLWNVDAQDWNTKASADSIGTILESRVKPGAIVLLHDSGGQPGAPEKTLQALQSVIPRLKKRGFEFVTLSRGLGADKVL